MKFNKTQLAALALLLTTASSQADAVIIQNNSFENPGGGTGQYPSADSWNGSSFTEISADVLLTGGHLARYAGQNSGNTATQDLGVGFSADSQYTLTILLGDRTTDAGNPTGTATFGLTAGGIDLGDFTQVTPAQVVDNTFQEFIYTFTTGAVAPTGNIGISLGALGGRAAFDNVRLNVGVRNSDFKITAISRPGNGNVQLSFVSQPGQSYGVESSLTLAQGSWVNTGVTATGTGAIQTVEVQDNNSTQRRFFRIKELGAAILATPGNPVATAYSRSLVDFTWTDVAGETGYEVQWDEASNFASPTTLLPLSSNTA